MTFASSVRPPPADLVAAVEQRVPGLWRSFVSLVDRAASGLDVTATSWWRDRATNADVGGAQFSQHLLGLALDVDGPDRQTFMKRAGGLGLIVLQHAVPGGRLHVHVQALPAGLLQMRRRQ